MFKYIVNQSIKLNNLTKAQLVIASDGSLTKTQINDYFLEENLHPLEIEHYTQNTNPFEFLSSRIIAKQAICSLLGKDIKYNQIAIKKAILGFPVVKIKGYSNIQISLSHNQGYYGCVAFNEEYPLALDIEKLNLRKLAQVTSQLTTNEINNFTGFDEDFNSLTVWTIKESLAKMLRTGLFIDFKFLEISQITKKRGYFESHFTNFSQFKALSFKEEDLIYSILMPANINVKFIKKSPCKD